jgi:non-specific serine/threonine protein kinase
MNLVNNKDLIAIYTAEGFYLDYENTTKQKNLNLEMLNRIYDDYSVNPYQMLFNLGFEKTTSGISSSIEFLQDLSKLFIHELSRKTELELLLEKTQFSIEQDSIDEVLLSLPYVIGMEYITADWIKNILKKLYDVLQEELVEFNGTVSDYLTNKNENLTLAGRVYFHLVESKLDEFPFAFLATYSTVKNGNRKAIHTPLENALIEFKNDQQKLLSLLSTVSKVVKSSPFISEIVESGEIFKPLKLTSNEAYTFLQEVPLYEASGILCRIPNWWKKKSNSFKINLNIGENKQSHVGLESLMSFDPSLHLGDEELTQEDLMVLLECAEGLQLIKGKWIEVNHEKLQKTLEAYERAQDLADKGYISMAEAMRMQLDVKERLAIEDDIEIEFKRGLWLKKTLNQLSNPEIISEIKTSEHFNAQLRHYQKDGLKWLHMMGTCGFGACLADDMGLGKTVQVIALLDVLRLYGETNALLVVPASLMGNWQRELDHFGPAINYKLLYSKKEMLPIDELSQFDLVITTYGLVSRIEELHTKEWQLLILDEAQAIKNPATKQTKAIKKIPAITRIALTGTPIENNLTDLWSLFDFLNKGLLGSTKEFKSFVKQLGEKHSDYGKLKEMISPFILRRLKTDKTVISELPDKVELKKYIDLSKKQIALYHRVLKDLEKSINEAEGIQRRGMVLGSISKFKQICNHPDHYAGFGEFKTSHSGKFLALEKICQTIYEKREKVLVFTQFREMTEPLSNFLEEIFGREGLVIHGGTPVKNRSEIVARFQSEEHIPFMILSLKAGGVGLNLTAANHVIHFDRWWNPAVENQATDRAFRIGQHKNVMVHKLIAKGTIEEKIDDMIEEKIALSNDLIGSTGEKWITELDNHELLELFSLSL